MKDLRQIQMIAKALNKQREKYIYDLGKINASISSKNATIQKMIVYENDYAMNKNLQLTQTLPSLQRNLTEFSKKIAIAIRQAELEVIKLQKIAESTWNNIQKIDQKIKLFDVFESRSKLVKLNKAEKVEQIMMDDLSLLKHYRSDHE